MSDDSAAELRASFTELTSPAVHDLATRTKVAFIVVTQTAQAGEHLPVGSRYLIGHEIARRVVRRLAAEGCPSLIGAVLPFGFSGYNASYPGCIQLSPDTLTQVVVEVGQCLAREGFTRLVLMSNAGGNPPSMVLATHRLAEQPGVRPFYLDLQRLRPRALKGVLEGARPHQDNHAGEWETSCLLAIAPHLVDMTRASCWYPQEDDERNALPFEGLSQHERQLAVGVHDNHGWVGPTGVIGDARLGTAVKGERILDNFAALAAGHVKKWAFDLSEEVAQIGRAAAQAGTG